MRKVLVGLAGVSLVAGLVTTFPTSAAALQKPVERPVRATDDWGGPLQEKARALRQQAVAQVLNGEAKVQEKNGSRVVKLAATSQNQSQNQSQGRNQGKDQYVELSRERTDRVFVVLVEFGNQRHPQYPDRDTNPDVPGPQRFGGPRHNQIARPGRHDNSTIWRKDFSQKYFQKLYFGVGKGVESLRTYYETQSSGRYSVEGKVTDWVKVPYNEARYGRSDGYPCDEIVCQNSEVLAVDAMNTWAAGQRAKGRTTAQIRAELAEFDQWDRYDGDGDFNEPDGYLDHLQIVHAGSDQASEDPVQGEDAIWSHFGILQHQGEIGEDGPKGHPYGGAPIGKTGIWIDQYTVQAENGGLSVIAHEYAHDLGLPDDYDIDSEGDPTEWWSLMGQARLSGKGEAPGTRPGDLGAWNKLMLGWLDYRVVKGQGQEQTIDLGPAEFNTARPQAVVVALPKKRVTHQLTPPPAGKRAWWGGAGHELNNTLTRTIQLPEGSPKLTFQAQWEIEDCGLKACDSAFVEVDDGSGTGWKAIPGSITSRDEGNGIDGSSVDWEPATFDLRAYAGQKVKLRFRYTTDAAGTGMDRSIPSGIRVDRIAVRAGRTVVFEDGAEALDQAWTVRGFRRTTDTVKVAYDHFYIAANRSYVSYDKYLRTGPFNFGRLRTRPNWVERFPYQQGLLVTYWDTSQTDNGVAGNPGRGRNLTVDAHPKSFLRSNGKPWRTRVQLYDAPFGRLPADDLTLHVNGRKQTIKGLKGNPLFDDTKNYFDPMLKEHGVKVANAGVKIRVLKQNNTAMKIQVTTR